MKKKQEKKEKKLSRAIAENILKVFGFRGVVILGFGTDKSIVAVYAGRARQDEAGMNLLAEKIGQDLEYGDLRAWG